MDGMLNVLQDKVLNDANATILTMFDEGSALGGAEMQKTAQGIVEVVKDYKIDNLTGLITIVGKSATLVKKNGDFVKNASAESYTLLVKPQAEAYVVQVDDRALRLQGPARVIDTSAREHGYNVALRRVHLFRRDIRKGLTAKAPGEDSPAFWSTAQLINPATGAAGGTYSNKLALALNDDNYATAYAALSSFVSEDGVTARGLIPTHILVGPDLFKTAQKIVMAPQIFGGATNVNSYEGVKVVVVHGLQAGEWILCAADEMGKPFGYSTQLEAVMEYRGPVLDSIGTKTHVWRVDVEDALSFVMPYRSIYSKAP